MVPGLVEAHGHSGGSIFDLNDAVYLTNPGMRSLSAVTPESDFAKDALAGGVTSTTLIPGSATNMGGFGTAIHYAGKDLDEVLLKKTVWLSCR